MKKILVFLVAATAFMSVQSQAADLKIGVVNVPRVLEESPQATTARESLQKEFAPRERELLDLRESIQKMETRLSRDGAIMSETERGKLERDVLAKKREYQREEGVFRDDLNFKRNELLQNMQRQLVENIRQFAEKEKFDLLLGEGVIYVKDEYNVTEQVLKHLKSKK